MLRTKFREHHTQYLMLAHIYPSNQYHQLPPLGLQETVISSHLHLHMSFPFTEPHTKKNETRQIPEHSWL